MLNDEGMGYEMTGVGDSLSDRITGFYGGSSLIFLALIIVGIVLLVRDIRVSSEAGLTGDSPTASNRRGEVTGKAAPPGGNDTG